MAKPALGANTQAFLREMAKLLAARLFADDQQRASEVRRAPIRPRPMSARRAA